MLFKKPIELTHTVEVNIPDLKEAADPVLDRIAHMAKTGLIALAIGIPAVILFALSARVGAEVLVDHLTQPIE